MKNWAIVASFLAGCLAMGGYCVFQGQASVREQQLEQLESARNAVLGQIGHRRLQIQEQLKAFARAVAGDQDFSMKLIAEQDRSAGEVSDIAVRYMVPMGFSLLEVADSADVMLSCGHFPALAGNRISTLAGDLDSLPVVVPDMIQTDSVLTLQARITISIAEMVPLSCVGGVIVDSAFLSSLVPGTGIRCVVRQGNRIIGRGVTTLSTYAHGTIAVNDTVFPAAEIELPWSGGGDPPVLYVCLEAGKRAGTRPLLWR